MSLDRQPPPKPSPADRNRRPMRVSWPSASARVITSAPAASHTFATALMKEILVARNAFAATFTSSAVARSVTMYGVPSSSTLAYTARSVTSAASRRDAHHDPVRPQRVLDREALAEEFRVPGQARRGARRGEPGDPGGQPGRGADRHRGLADHQAVPGQVRGQPVHHRLDVAQVGARPAGQLRRPDADEVDVAELRRLLQRGAEAELPEPTARTRISSSPGSKKGARPSRSAAIFRASVSTPRTSCPRSAMQAACTAPRYPVPMTVMRILPLHVVVKVSGELASVAVGMQALETPRVAAHGPQVPGGPPAPLLFHPAGVGDECGDVARLPAGDLIAGR